MNTPIYDELVTEVRSRTPESVLERIQRDRQVIVWRELWRAEREAGS